MKATLTIQMDNAAFGDTPELELGRIFRALADYLFDPVLEGLAGIRLPVQDSNGNTVGSLTIEED